MASVRRGTARIAEIVGRFGADVLSDALAQILARTRRLVRTRLAGTFATGTHRFTDAIDGDGHGNGPFRLRFALTREAAPDGEDRFIFDATETDDQAPGPVNLLMNPAIPGMTSRVRPTSSTGSSRPALFPPPACSRSTSASCPAAPSP